MTKYQEAEKSMAAYDNYVFSSAGRSFSADHADTLAAIAVVDCEVASRDRTVNQVTRDYYRLQVKLYRDMIVG